MTRLSEKKVRLFNQLFSIENNWHNVLYVHTPFCLKKCYYCVYSSKAASGKAEIDHFYNTVIPGQIEQYGILENLRFDQIYFGGGTPTIVGADRLEKIYKQIPNFREIPIKMSEASPYTVTDEHLNLFGKYGFKFVSLGVQTLSKKILEAQNRFAVSREKLYHICRELDKFNIISNIDLIFYLDSGGPGDLAQTGEDLNCLMSGIRPVSITLHSNYMKKKSPAKRKGMYKVIRKMLEKYPEYDCTNALLDDSDVEVDMKMSAEYRLMRKEKDFCFYMIPKLPQSHTFGHNMLSIGEYENFKPRYNYFYIFDFMDKYAYLEYLKKLNFIISNFIEIRQKLGFSYQHYVGTKVKNFFAHPNGKKKFKEILKSSQLPYYDLEKLEI